MFRTESLQIKLIGAFILMGAIVFVVALVGWLGNYRMNQHVKTFSEDTLPTIIGLWQIHECQTQIESSQILLDNPILPPEERTEYLQRMNQAMQKI
ncbi:MCP four helix bundle domain-containing protein [[Phormidium] sp. ETS-05]|uniref:MCP four helix bundle domain-containing protein n=1 Tax=[Phormidium] sp. ETS-05 TaxID=222819 RepID=UPI0018EEE758|nr:MCP four helix bundle domain-containing protein [[Phormidium] sp. ETS-05]